MPTYYVSLQKHFTPFNTPEVTALVHTLKARFPTDDQLTVIPMYGANNGFFKIIVSDPLLDGEFNLQVMVEGHSTDLPLLTDSDFQNLRGIKKGGQQWAEGTLVTLYNSTLGPLSEVTNKEFDTLLAYYGEVTRPTQLQTHKGTTVLNGNRYCVLKHTNALPDHLSVPDPTRPGKFCNVTLSFKGKEKFCVRCMKRHPGACPELQEFYKARDLRREQTITKKIISDSTLRHADETGLNSDLVCMSGGRLGNISDVIPADPTMQTVTDVIVVAGQNDLLRDNETFEEFKAIADKSLALLEHLAFKLTLAVVQPLVPQDCPTLVQQKATYLDDLCSQRATDPSNPLLYINNLPVIEMSGIHPTIEGTATLLKWIDIRLKIITDGRYITDAKMYRGGKSIYKYGCLLCPKYLNLDFSFICPDCGPTHYSPTSGEVIPGQGDPPLQQPGAANEQSSTTDVEDITMDPAKGLGKRPLHEETDISTPTKILVLSDQNASLPPTNDNHTNQDDISK